jgi:hypothetical protein
MMVVMHNKGATGNEPGQPDMRAILLLYYSLILMILKKKIIRANIEQSNNTTANIVS